MFHLNSPNSPKCYVKILQEVFLIPFKLNLTALEPDHVFQEFSLGKTERLLCELKKCLIFKVEKNIKMKINELSISSFVSSLKQDQHQIVHSNSNIY